MGAAPLNDRKLSKPETMPLPEFIEIIPLTQPVQARVTVPGSKSITNRVLVLAALAYGETILNGALWSEDTQVMVDCLQTLGYMVTVEEDPAESCNRTITVYGQGGQVPRGGSPESPLELFVGNAGTAARFLSAMVCLGQGVYRLHGVSRMHERPQADLFRSLRALGYRIEAAGDTLPVDIYGEGPKKGRVEVSIEASSQFASALLLGARLGGWEIDIRGENAEQSPYVVMTSRLVEQFNLDGGHFQVEPDASSGSYFWAAGHMVEASKVEVLHWPHSGWQIDQKFPDFWPLPDSLSRKDDLGDSIMTAVVLAVLSGQPRRFEDLGRLRVQECERVEALKTELTKCGVDIREEGDSLTVFPSSKTMHGAEIETYEDHRMAMCLAILGLKLGGMKLKNPACVKKTFPNFFQKLAALPPHGLGVEIRDAVEGRVLTVDELFAD
jgi:3-phosphoshikimate 1-carboxyvinyltransferase